MIGKTPAPAGLSVRPLPSCTEPEVLASRVVTHCGVNAGGIPAEWVEADVATEGQFTLIYLIAGGPESLEKGRRTSAAVAAATGARVLTIACSSPETGMDGGHSAVQRGVAAYAWLLGEGCDLDRTAVTDDSADNSLTRSVLAAAASAGLLIPNPDRMIHISELDDVAPLVRPLPGARGGLAGERKGRSRRPDCWSGSHRGERLA